MDNATPLDRAVLEALDDAVIVLDAARLPAFANLAARQWLGLGSGDASRPPVSSSPALEAVLGRLEAAGVSLDRMGRETTTPLLVEHDDVPGRRCWVTARQFLLPGGAGALLLLRRADAPNGHPAPIETVTAGLSGELAAGTAHALNNLFTVLITAFDQILDEQAPARVEASSFKELRDRTLHGVESLKLLQVYSRATERGVTLVNLTESVNQTVWAVNHLIGPSLRFTVDLPPDEVLCCEASRRDVLLALLAGAQMVARRLNGRGQMVLRLRSAASRTVPALAEKPARLLAGFTFEEASPPGATPTRRGLGGASNDELTRSLAAWASGLGGWAGWTAVSRSMSVWEMFLPLFGAQGSAAPTSVSQPARKASVFAGVRVLVADDDSMVRSLVVSVLRREGMTVVEAGDGEEAVMRWVEHQGQFDLAVLDLRMPRLGGEGALEQLRVFRPDLKALFLTGSIADNIPTTALALQKPFRNEELLHLVKHALNA